MEIMVEMGVYRMGILRVEMLRLRMVLGMMLPMSLWMLLYNRNRNHSLRRRVIIIVLLIGRAMTRKMGVK